METRSSPCMQQLRAVASERGLKYYKHLSKPELFALLQREGGVPMSIVEMMTMAEEEEEEGRAEETNEREEKTKRRTRSKKRKHPEETETEAATQEEDDKTTAKSKSKKAKHERGTTVNTLDPIMLTELGPYTFEFVRPNGTTVVYNVETLAQYMLATGHFAEPETRIPFSDEDLRRIDTEAQRAKLDLRSVFEAKRNMGVFDEAKVKRDGLLGMERCAGEFVSKMLDIVESEDAEEGEIELIVTVFPSFSSIFAQLRKSDKEYAKQCMSHFKAYLRGPKNRPIVDRSGLLPVILSFLEDVSSGRQDATSFGF